MENKSLVNIIIVGVIALVVGYFVGASQGVSKNVVAEYEKKLDAVKKLFPEIQDLRNISGTVTSVNGDIVTLQADNSQHPLDNLPEVREVVVATSTIITKAIRMSQDEIREVTGLIQGSPVTIQDRQAKADISDIKEGDVLNISATKNIKTDVRFDAYSIYILPPIN